MSLEGAQSTRGAQAGENAAVSPRALPFAGELTITSISNNLSCVQTYSADTSQDSITQKHLARSNSDQFAVALQYKLTFMGMDGFGLSPTVGNLMFDKFHLISLPEGEKVNFARRRQSTTSVKWMRTEHEAYPEREIKTHSSRAEKT